MNPFVVNPAKSTPVIHHNGTPGPHRLAPEILTGRVRHFRDRVIFCSRPLIHQWLATNRQVVQGRMKRKRGAKLLGQPALRGWYALRDLKEGLSNTISVRWRFNVRRQFQNPFAAMQGEAVRDGFRLIKGVRVGRTELAPPGPQSCAGEGSRGGKRAKAGVSAVQLEMP